MRSVLKNRRIVAHVTAHDPQRLTTALVITFLLVVASLLNFAATVSVRAQNVSGDPSEMRTPLHVQPAFDGERALAHVRALVELGPRPAGSKELERARAYIVGALKSYGLKVGEDGFDVKTPVGKRRMFNVTAEMKGDGDDFIIIASHYDTKLYKQFRFVGANDGGSSTGALLELARVLAASRRPHFSYRFVFFDGEEAFCAEWDECAKPNAPDNTYGSRRYVERLRSKGEIKKLRALVLLDMIGYEKLELGRDEMSTPWLVETIWQTARELGYSKQFAERMEGIGGDDHEPFLREGVPSVDLIQLNSYPHWHTPEDTMDKISASSLKAVGDVVLASLLRVEKKLRGEGQKVGGEGRH